MIGAIIFDVDGTLAETEELHRRAFNETFAAIGVDWYWDRDDYRDLLTTTGGKERIARFLRHQKGDPAPMPVADIHRAKTERFVALMAEGEIGLRPGIGALIDEARRASVRLAIATTTSLPNVEALCRACFGAAASDIFEVIAAGDMVAEKKPSPQVYHLALRELGLSPDRAVALEDSLNGLRAAKAAGLRCIVSPGFYTRHEEFAGADRLVGCFSQLGGLAGLEDLVAVD
ncbi:HAD family hydrolase [Cereibacter sphaeroides]|uniref:HAD family hydrolase n=1 Tax=Cereibacter sphaeroides TaxID=1063 RepID=UPI001F16691C|nr:HAD family hydrolase [Cereibacter sphaeroides]MCE6952327.1 HAD family hydrolase [Cereibacter sphaeroides]